MEQQNIDRLNRQLLDEFGRLENCAVWRIMWSDSQMEYRYGTYRDFTSEGVFLREVSEVRLVPKYRQWAPSQWMLERLLVVPEDSDPDHPQLTDKISYEPIWAFETELPPTWVGVKFIVESVYSNMEQANKGYTKYKDPDSEPEEAAANKEARLKELEQTLFSDESDIGDALAYKQGVGYTGPPMIQPVK